VNISSQLISFIEKLNKNKKLILQEEQRKILLNKIIEVLKENKEKTKLNTKLFSLIPFLIIYKNENKSEYLNELKSVLNIIYEYIQSDNLDKLRIAGLLSLDKIINNISEINNTNNINIFKENEEIKLQTLKILFLLLNDEYSNIRKKASEIFIIFNNLTNIINFKKCYTTLLNDYICQKILTKIDINKESNKKFCEYILENNFYFRINVFETKIFYIETDNNYIDNSQNKMLIFKNLAKNKQTINYNKNIEEFKQEEKIMMVFEEFTDKIKNICINIIKDNKINDENKQDYYKFIYKNIIRPKIYL
jgi:hypothetical protein